MSHGPNAHEDHRVLDLRAKGARPEIQKATQIDDIRVIVRGLSVQRGFLVPSVNRCPRTDFEAGAR